MPARSKAQYRFMQGVAHGSIHAPGLSKAQAAEYVSGQSPRSLPEKVSEKPHERVAKKMKAKAKPKKK